RGHQTPFRPPHPVPSATVPDRHCPPRGTGVAVVQHRVEAPRQERQAPRLWGNPDFRLLVVGQTISTCGDMFFLVTLPFLIFGEGCYRREWQSIRTTVGSDVQMPALNADNITTNLVSTVVGRAVGGIGVVIASRTGMLALDAASFVCSVGTLLLIRSGRRYEPG